MVTICKSALGELQELLKEQGYNMSLVVTENGWLKASFGAIPGYEEVKLPKRLARILRLRVRLKGFTRIVFVKPVEPIEIEPIFLVKYEDGSEPKALVVLPVMSTTVVDDDMAYEAWIQKSGGLDGELIEGKVLKRASDTDLAELAEHSTPEYFED